MFPTSGTNVQHPRPVKPHLNKPISGNNARQWTQSARLLIGMVGIWLIVVFGPLAGAQAQSQNEASVETIKVVAIEYPPFLGSDLVGYGISFAAIQRYADAHFKVRIVPDFVPPARAKRRALGEDWCISAYPADPSDSGAYFVKLLEDTIEIGLYRKRRPANLAPFRWDNLSELRGSTVAILRSNVEGEFHRLLRRSGIEPIFVETPSQGFQMLLNDRIDYAQGDSLSLSTMPEVDPRDVEFSESYMFEVESGFHYRLSCAHRIFKDGHIPHLTAKGEAGELMQ